jgi:hypothetical protein
MLDALGLIALARHSAAAPLAAMAALAAPRRRLTMAPRNMPAGSAPATKPAFDRPPATFRGGLTCSTCGTRASPKAKPIATRAGALQMVRDAASSRCLCLVGSTQGNGVDAAAHRVDFAIHTLPLAARRAAKSTGVARARQSHAPKRAIAISSAVTPAILLIGRDALMAVPRENYAANASAEPAAAHLPGRLQRGATDT